MKIIFLDFDGVINNWHTPSNNKVDYENVKILKEIIDKTGASIVATSANKYGFQRGFVSLKHSNYYEYLQKLKKYGINIHDVTPYVNGNRKEEILAYLSSHPEITQYLILDDDIIIFELISHEVYLDLYDGLKEEHITPSINILNGNLAFYPASYDITETYQQKLNRINKHYT